MALPLDPNSGLPLDPATLQALQQHQLMQSIGATGGNSAERLNDMTAGLAVRSLFPNAQMRQAQTAQQAMASALAGLPPQADGESDLDFGVRRLRAQRDAISPIDPNAAAGLDQQLMKLGEAAFQQRHLTAQDQRLNEEEADRHQEAQIKTAVGAPYHLVGAKGENLGSFNMLDPDERNAFLQTKQANPGSTPMSEQTYAQHIDRMAEIKARADETAQAKARFGAGALGSFGDPQVEGLLASLASKGIAMPVGFRSKDQMLATFKGLLTKYNGLSTDDIADLIGAGFIDYKAIGKATQTGATILGRVTAASGELDAMLPIARDASAGVPRGDFVPYNKLTQMVREGTSSPEQKRLYVSTQAILNSYDLLAARGGTDATKRAQQHKMLETADGPEAYNAALDMLATESRVAKAGAIGAIRAGTYGKTEQGAAGPATAQPSTSNPNQPTVRTYDPSTGTFH